jgi:cell wall-associated NlpC family hydrolase
MFLFRSRGRARRALIAVALVAALVTPALDQMSPAGADPSSEVSGAVDAFEIARSRLATAEATLRDSASQRASAQQQWADATAALAAADARLADERDHYGALSAEYYVRQGADDKVVNDSMYLALSGRRQSLDRAKDVQKAAAGDLRDAEKTLSTRQATLDNATGDHDAALSAANEAGARADQAIADTGARDLPAVAYIAYRNAASSANAAHSDCRLSTAVLAGVGRISSGHGRNQGSTIDSLGRVEPALRGLRGTRTADTDQGTIDGDAGGDRSVGPMQLSPTTWAANATDGDGDGSASPDDLFDAAATTAEVLCAPDKPLDTFAPLDRAVGALLGEGQQSTVALGTARRYARTDELDMGKVPDDPRAAAGDDSPRFDTSDTNLAPGDVLGMIDWAMTRVSTPYSQCLGVDARPQDPECPPGTNRFGAGFFDCSGFVSSAYRRIGIGVPATTYAMEANPGFMATQVSDHIDLKVMEPGDVFLMDGHTGLYVGGGMIIHAISGGLTYEPVPGWVANGTFAVLRPLDLP